MMLGAKGLAWSIGALDPCRPRFSDHQPPARCRMHPITGFDPLNDGGLQHQCRLDLHLGKIEAHVAGLAGGAARRSAKKRLLPRQQRQHPHSLAFKMAGGYLRGFSVRMHKFQPSLDACLKGCCPIVHFADRALKVVENQVKTRIVAPIFNQP
ncbi:MAG: hypothetical protein ACTSUY_01560 [Alphaproteobacteria bacterium]